MPGHKEGVGGDSRDAEVRFSAMYEAHYWALVRFAQRRLGDEATARDVVAESFTVAWRRWDRVPQENPLPWLYAVSRGVIANERRRRDRAEALDHRLREQAPARESGPLPDQVPERLQETQSALAGLPALDQEVLRLHAWEGLSGRELATALGCSATAAGVRLHRARQRLKRAVRSQQTAGDGGFTVARNPRAQAQER